MRYVGQCCYSEERKMKPIVIDANNMTFDEIKDAIEEAYQAGYDDGYKAGQRSMQLTWHGDPIPTTSPTPHWWDNYKYEVTCSAKDENKIDS